jgi:hypothetical protein
LDPAEKETREGGKNPMNLKEYKALFIITTCVVSLIVASPALGRLLVYPRTEFFSELWLLGSNHLAEDYPYNITRNQNYSVYLGIGNQLGYYAYYVVEVKFRNATQSAPTSLGPIENRTPSSLASLYNITAFVPDQSSWERQLTFSFHYVMTSSTTVEFGNLTLNNRVLNLAGESSAWNATSRVFFGDLIFEMWIYNTSLSGFQFHGRSVDLKFNMTV